MQLPWITSEPPSSSASSQHSSSTRSAVRNRLSALFHGSSVIGDKTHSPRQQSSNMARHKARTRELPRFETRSSFHLNAPAPRSPSSTRSLIDPASSPANSARPFSNATYDQFSGNPFSPAPAHIAGSPRTDIESGMSIPQNRNGRRRRGPRWRPKHSSGKVYLPIMKNKGMRERVFKCIVSGGVLAITLIVCKSPLHH